MTSLNILKIQGVLKDLRRLYDEAKFLVDTSVKRDHFYDEAGYIINAIPTLLDSLELYLGSEKVAYSKPVEDISGYRTLVRKDNDVSEGVSDVDRTPERALPKPVQSPPSGGQENRLPGPDDNRLPSRPQFISPAPGSNLPTVKTLGKPGEDYGTPYKDDLLLTRRTMKAFQRKIIREILREEWLND